MLWESTKMTIHCYQNMHPYISPIQDVLEMYFSEVSCSYMHLTSMWRKTIIKTSFVQAKWAFFTPDHLCSRDSIQKTWGKHIKQNITQRWPLSTFLHISFKPSCVYTHKLNSKLYRTFYILTYKIFSHLYIEL